jgi:hypothetical protein
MSETWWEYVQRISANAPHKEIAAAAGVDQSRMTGWKHGDRPKADNATAFARHYNRQPVEALIAAGYLEASDVDGVVEITASASELTTDDLLHEVGRRFSAWHQTEGWADGWGDGSQQPPSKRLLRDESPRMRRGQEHD